MNRSAASAHARRPLGTLGVPVHAGPAVIGHRGWPARFPENSLSSLEAAWNAGAPMVELDVCQSADGVLVVMHDETVDRTTDGTGRIDRLPWSRIVRLRLAGGEPPPRLEEVLERLGRCRWVNIELKSIHDVARAARVLGAHRRPLQVILSSFDWDLLTSMQELVPAFPAALLTEERLVDPASAVLARGARGLHPEASLVTRDMVESLHAAGLWIIVWTVDDPAKARQFSILGVDGLVTNDVERISAGLRAASGAAPDGSVARRGRKAASRASLRPLAPAGAPPHRSGLSRAPSRRIGSPSGSQRSNYRLGGSPG